VQFFEIAARTRAVERKKEPADREVIDPLTVYCEVILLFKRESNMRNPFPLKTLVSS
jgi:hypothetical protein